VDLDEQIAESFLAPLGSELPAADMQVIKRDGWYQTITPSTKSTQGNEVVFSRIAPEDAERVARETIATYTALGLPFKWCVGPLTEPADFGAVLDRLGMTSWPLRGMAIDPSAWSGARPADVSVERVGDESFEDYYATLVRGWAMEVGEGASWRDSLKRARAGGNHHWYLARIDGVPVASAAMIAKPRSAYFVGAATLEPYRGRGVYRALLDERLRHASELGYTLATTQAREATSAPILERLGFRTLYRSRVYKWQP
jgi:GNAT superfamily N-acetyltransferase